MLEGGGEVDLCSAAAATAADAADANDADDDADEREREGPETKTELEIDRDEAMVSALSEGLASRLLLGAAAAGAAATLAVQDCF